MFHLQTSNTSGHDHDGKISSHQAQHIVANSQLKEARVSNLDTSIYQASSQQPATLAFQLHNPIAIKPQVSQYGSADGMEEILHGESEENRKKFADFVRSKYASNTLHFYDDIVAYQKLSSKKEMKRKGTEIIKKFILDSPEAIDVPSEMKEDLLKLQSSGNFQSNSFDGPKRIAFDLLKSNFYHRFLDSTGL